MITDERETPPEIRIRVEHTNRLLQQLRAEHARAYPRRAHHNARPIERRIDTSTSQDVAYLE